MEVLKKIRFKAKGNVLDRVDVGLTPYLVDPVSLIGNSKIQWLGIIAPTQSGKTVFLQASVADAIDQDPGPGLYLLPDEKSGKKQLVEKVISMIEESPDLASHMTGKVRDVSKEGIHLDNMTIYPGWGGSLATMSSLPMKRVWLDEVRLMPLTVGKESNAIKLGGDRLTTYFEFGIGQGYMVSSPSVEGDLLHQQLSIPGTLYVGWQVQCSECGEYQELDFFVNMLPYKGKCKCRFCQAEFDDKDKKKGMNATGKYAPYVWQDNKWKPTKIYRDGTLEQPFEYEDYNRVFFHWGSLESPFRSFAAIWKEYLQTKDKLHDYKNFIQCWLARFWIEDKSKTSMLVLKQRKHPELFKGDVPLWPKVILAGVDTQDNGFYVSVRAFGSGRRTHLVDQFFIPCALMDVLNYEEIVRLFNTHIFNRVYATVGPPSKSKKWRIFMAGIDTGGHRTKEIYAASDFLPRLRLVKGVGSEQQKIPITYNNDLNLYLVKTGEYLEETDHCSTQETFTLFNNVEDDFLVQYVNVRKTELENKRTGEKTAVWKKIGQCDYRYADIHNFICLDIPTDRGMIRNHLEESDFILNPYQEELDLMKKHENLEQSKSTGDDRFDSGYSIGNFDW